MSYSRKELKQGVRQRLRAARPDPRLVTLAYLAASFVLTCVVKLIHSLSALDPMELLGRAQELITMTQAGQMGFQRMVEELLAMRGQFGGLFGKAILFGLISSAVTWTLTYGYHGYCLNLIRGKRVSFLTLLCAFPKWGWVLLSGFLVSLFMVMWAVLFCFMGVVATLAVLLFVPEGRMTMILIVVVWVLLVIWLVSIELSYSMTNFILLDDKVDALEVISRSKDMTRGRKRHLFMLMLSFLGWMLLAGVVAWIASAVVSLITGGASSGVAGVIGRLAGGVPASDVVARLLTLPLMVWLQPYMTASIAKFYDMMRHTDIAYGDWEGRITPTKKVNPQAAARKAESRPEAPAEASVPEADDRPEYE